MIVYDAAGVKTALSPDGSGSVYDAQGRRISASSVTAQLYTFDNAPASPSAYDDEFQVGSLDAKWTMFSTGTTNPVVAGAVNPTSSLTTPILDLGTMPSWLLSQSDNSSAAPFGVYQAITLDTNATIFIKMGLSNGIISSVNEGNMEMKLGNDADANESIYLSYSQQGAGSGFAVQLTVENNGVFTVVVGPTIVEKATVSPTYAALWKAADVYHAAFGTGSGPMTYLGSVTKTGVTTLNRMYLRFLSANETPSMIEGFDFVRYYGSVTYGLMNPTI